MGARDSASTFVTTFGARLREERRRHGFTQDELAARAECSAVTLSKLERGENLPTFDVLLSLSIALGTSPNDLVGWPDSGANRFRQSVEGLLSAAEKLPDDWVDLLAEVAVRASQSAKR